MWLRLRSWGRWLAVEPPGGLKPPLQFCQRPILDLTASQGPKNHLVIL